MIHYIIRIDNTAKHCKLHTFVDTNSNFGKDQIFQPYVIA